MQDDGQTLATAEEFHSLAVRRLLSRHGRLWTQQVSADHTSIQFGLLLCLARSVGGLSQSEIAEQLAVDRATLTELVHRMSAQGHVTVSRDPRDGRRRVATLTDSGRDLLRELYHPALEVNDQLFTPLTAEETEQLTALLRRVLAHDTGAPPHHDPA
ncbi:MULTISPECIES: MarR family winged helix-turn-helix transcriptional regulator [Micrococcaceae]|uniref:MarR family winged helix-turn-helix transcriptional regulator n=1 Tax=Micrococcaceae TaxID=1268 RepID=UPI001607CF30|nr:MULTISPECIES: MarR family transcriptional regulator [Micrococcaceae]MBB5750219.1 DNA-binding MarR family transcriptional regulator [Micrococcus sp. TA1]HRO29852.1 MarR family transcriptional regulator [Citricoccus sp.]HRO93754.1 MarR family transcriptional regulator [Citricoccus sp.]